MSRLGLLVAVVCSFAASVLAQDVRLRLERRLTAGSAFHLVWSEHACDDPAATVVRSLDATMTIATVDRAGRPMGLDIEVRSATDTTPAAPAGARIHLDRLAPRAARLGHADWGGPSISDPASAQTRTYLTSLLVPLMFPDAPDRAWGTGRARSVGDTWTHRGIERREGFPIHRYRLPGTARVEGREDLGGVPTTHVVIEGAARADVPLWEGAYRSHAEDVAESIELWVPDDAARPFPHVLARRSRTVVSVTTETTRTTSAWCDEIRIEPIAAE